MKGKLTREIKIGIFALLALIMVYWGVNYLKGSNVLDSRRTFYALYDRVEGLEPNRPVTINGLKVGQVEKIYFHTNQSGKLVVEMKLTTAFKFPKDTRCVLSAGGLLGDKFIDLVAGASAEMAKDGDTLESEKQQGLTDKVSEQIGPLTQRAGNALAKLDSVLTSFDNILDKRNQKDIQRSFAALANSLEEMDKNLVLLRKFQENNANNLTATVGNVASITGALRESNDNLKKTIENLAQLSDSLQAAQLGKTLKDLNDITTKINNGEGTMGKMVNDPQVYDQLNETLFQLKRLLLDVQDNPKRYVHVSLWGKKGEAPDSEKISVLEKENRVEMMAQKAHADSLKAAAPDTSK
jgi:phospholipid/cholesterol/gamma-HCH transport system substrate-binding protein